MMNEGAPSMTSVQEAIVTEMAGLEGNLQQYAYLVGLGRALQTPEPSIRQEAHAVPGCQSRIWIRAELRSRRMHILADAEAMITRGIIALLLRVLDGRTPAEILDGDLFFLDRTGLKTHLSPARGNGLAAVVQRIRTCTEEAIGATRSDPRPARNDVQSPAP
jgi:cysteine desulfuration protein SufE